MQQIITASLLAVLAQPALAEIERIESDAPVAQTMDALLAAVNEAGATVFARVDHAEGARGAGPDLPASQLLIFGNPRLGTPAMQADPRARLFLPMKVLVCEDGDGQVWLTYQEAEDMFDEIGIDDDAEYLGQMETALDGLVRKAAGA